MTSELGGRKNLVQAYLRKRKGEEIHTWWGEWVGERGGGDVRECRCAMWWFNLDFTFDLAIMTLSDF